MTRSGHFCQVMSLSGHYVLCTNLPRMTVKKIILLQVKRGAKLPLSYRISRISLLNEKNDSFVTEERLKIEEIQLFRFHWN